MLLLASHVLKFNSDYGFYMLFLYMFLITLIALSRHLVIAGILVVLLIVNYIYSGHLNHNFLRRNGEQGFGIVTEIEQTEIWVNDVRQLRLKVILKTREGQAVKTDFTTNDDIYDTKLNMERLPGPNIGEEFAILYLPGHKKNFSILPEDRSTPYGKRVVCTEIAGRLQSVTAAFKFTPNDEGARKDYERVLQEFQKNECI